MKLDMSTLIGVILSGGMVLVGLVLATGGDIGLLITLYVYQPSSFSLAVGGSLGAVILACPLERIKKLGSVLSRAAFEDPNNSGFGDLINEMTDYATEARRNGVLALDARTEEIKDEFIKTGIQLAVDGTAPDQIEEIMNLEVESLSKRHSDNQGMILKWAEFAPAFGMIGTLVGLVAMLANMSDPSTIGPSMAIAIITTLYGSMVANMFCIPFAAKLENRTKEEVDRKEMIIAAVLAIQNGDNPRVVRQKLMAYVAPDIRDAVAVTEQEG